MTSGVLVLPRDDMGTVFAVHIVVTVLILQVLTRTVDLEPTLLNCRKFLTSQFQRLINHPEKSAV